MKRIGCFVVLAIAVPSACGVRLQQQQRQLGRASRCRTSRPRAHRDGRGFAGQPDRLGRLRRGRLDRPSRRLGHRLREGHRLQGQRQDGNTSDEMVTLMRTGRYDGVSASGNSSLRLIAGGDVAPVDTNDPSNYADIVPRPQGPAVQLGQRADVRRAARRGRQPADVAPDKVSPAPTAGASSWTRTPSTRARSRRTTRRSTSPTRRCT